MYSLALIIFVVSFVVSLVSSVVGLWGVLIVAVYLLGLCSYCRLLLVCGGFWSSLCICSVCVVTVVCCWFVEGFGRRCVSARFV
jgi:hypothetical protein